MGLADLFRRSGPRCPRDDARLERFSRNGASLDQCPTCRGIWIDASQLRRIADNRELADADRWAGNYPQASGFSCPRCKDKCVGTFLEEFNVHTCVACHGVWIDHVEVESAHRHVSVVSGARGPELRTFLARL